jgi:hypothetical protein
LQQLRGVLGTCTWIGNLLFTLAERPLSCTPEVQNRRGPLPRGRHLRIRPSLVASLPPPRAIRWPSALDPRARVAAVTSFNLGY